MPGFLSQRTWVIATDFHNDFPSAWRLHKERSFLNVFLNFMRKKFVVVF